jgi:hypothetical protein
MNRLLEKCSTCENCGADNRPGVSSREFPTTGPSLSKTAASDLLSATNIEVGAVLADLGPPGSPIEEIARRRRSGPGLYAVYGAPDAWRMLGLAPSERDPLYVGKKETSASGRLLREHFAVTWTAKGSPTGHSTFRRSLAAGLREHLDLGSGAPRTKTNPSYFSNFGLADDTADARLSEWMRTNLHCSLWAAPAGFPTELLRALESEVIRLHRPPLNGSLPEHIKEGRRRFAAEARQWSPDS